MLINNNWEWAVVVAQLVEQLLTMPEVHGLNPVIGKKLYILNCQLCIEKRKIKKKTPGMAHLKNNNWENSVCHSPVVNLINILRS